MGTPYLRSGPPTDGDGLLDAPRVSRPSRMRASYRSSGSFHFPHRIEARQAELTRTPTHMPARAEKESHCGPGKSNRRRVKKIGMLILVSRSLILTAVGRMSVGADLLMERMVRDRGDHALHRHTA